MDILIRLFRVAVIWLRLACLRKQLPPGRSIEDRLREIDDEYRSDSDTWNREMYLARKKFLDREYEAGRIIATRGPYRPGLTYQSDAMPGWHHVPGTSKWEPDLKEVSQ